MSFYAEKIKYERMKKRIDFMQRKKKGEFVQVEDELKYTVHQDFQFH